MMIADRLTAKRLIIPKWIRNFLVWSVFDDILPYLCLLLTSKNQRDIDVHSVYQSILVHQKVAIHHSRIDSNNQAQATP
jgi:hypothetical protein